MDGELWEALYRFVELVDESHARDPRMVHRDAAVVAAYEYAVLHDRPACRACDGRNRAGVDPSLRPARLPSQPTLGRRLNHDPGTRRSRAELAAARVPWRTGTACTRCGTAAGRCRRGRCGR